MKSIIDTIKAKNIDTFQFYSKGGVFTEARENLHNRIIDKILSRGVYSLKKTVYMLGGATANGKSTLIKSGKLPHPAKVLKIDPDEVKEELPEYKFMLGKKDSQAAKIVHEESSYLKNRIRELAIEKEFDILVDGIANETLERRLEDLNTLRVNGHRVRIDYVTLDTELSLRLAEERGNKTGRYVPEEIIIYTNQAVAVLVPRLLEKPYFDELYLWDTNEEDNPRLVLQQINGNLEVLDKVLFERFKKKAHEYKDEE